ncbi:hypothetical protein Patl1_08176 [Pistacia atlantica]|uniref:Uncharacterized protein n=1 Tax=Pistacia atlantica TaxID=434234 RepID=A0ACC1AKQ6_9ROSI|nr:hypothetical protein Patl1_08176 [Pistacia atlantica]
MAVTARSLCAAALMIPIIADAALNVQRTIKSLNVQRTIKDLIAADAFGCFLESYPCGRNNFIPSVQPEPCP